ncbi:MAG: hypothetical protein ABJB03_10875 [Rhodoglobus sp.]
MLARRPRLSFILIGAGSAVVGLLPWLITGLRLPLQNLWGADTLPARMPLVLLPFSQYEVTVIVALLLVGSAIAGVVARATRARHPRSALPLAIGVVIVQVIAVVQTAVTVGLGLRHETAAALYLVSLVVGTAVTMLVGIGVFALIARAPRAGAMVGLSIAGIALGTWLSALLHPIGVVIVPQPLQELLVQLYWAPAIFVGAAIAWAGVGSIGRAIAAVVGIVLLWMSSALVTAIVMAVGSRILAAHPLDMLEYGGQVFRSALVAEGAAPWVAAVGVVAAAVGLVVRWVIVRRAGRGATAQ